MDQSIDSLELLVFALNAFFNPLVTRVEKIKIRKLGLTDLLTQFVKEMVDFDAHY